ncbi:MAG: hypothetical protein EB161_06730, partial [Nitrosopumilaceae archaeon]|nr:hypothetical protein [Nitrosopumilaceae archaeon]
MKTQNRADKIKMISMVFSVAMLFSGSALPAHAVQQTLTNTSIPLDIPLVMGYADGHKVFYITTETSNKDVSEHLTDLLGFEVTYAPAIAKTPKDALANIYEFTNGVEGSGPTGFQPNVADSQPGDPEYSPAWSVKHVTWTDESAATELTSEDEILAAKDATFVGHRGFAPDGSTIYYIATDASAKDAADALGVILVEKLGKTLVSPASSDLYAFTNGITGTGPLGFQASIGSTTYGDEYYSPFWRIQTVTWDNPESAEFLSMASEISDASADGKLKTALAGFIVNCPFIPSASAISSDTMMDKMDSSNGPVMTPVQQMKHGVSPSQVQCNDNLQLMLKKSNGSAICVSSESA